MQRTNRIIAACQAQGVELPGEWFSCRCPECTSILGYYDGYLCPNDACSLCESTIDNPVVIHIGPDLTLPENLHEALRLADALFDVPLLTGFNWETTGEDDIMRALGCTYSETDETIEVEGVGHIRIEAVNRACEKALGLSEWKEPTP